MCWYYEITSIVRNHQCGPNGIVADREEDTKRTGIVLPRRPLAKAFGVASA